ncbi:LysR family transcriptional regulator [Epidermidibacterium keratini]|uniref:LysR family transcriptional regulator n=1 Tax=Epidermidibacterium keratini TaxID=1891644 RepID=A0A7L4YRC9_9ACTN|nr:LysR family transcriptional regulator [Epidermidibacterium keratini]QHC01339.1 LysR family transcriptional regulator [Epidermidibacterium keratini]
MLSWERLRVLDAVAQHGSIGAAAAALHVTAPAVSQHLRKLSRESGVALLEPDGRGVRLSAAGRVLAEHARVASDAIAHAERDLAELSGEAMGPLRVGAVGSALRGLSQRALGHLRDHHPKVSPQVSDGEGIDMLPALRAGELDLAIVESWSTRPIRLPSLVETQVVGEEPVYVAVAADHRAASWDQARLHDLSDETWASCATGTDAYEALVQTMRDHGLEPRIAHRIGDYTSQLVIVAGGHAISLVPELARHQAPEGVVFVRCDSRIRRQIVAAYVRGHATPTVRAGIEAWQYAAGSLSAR